MKWGTEITKIVFGEKLKCKFSQIYDSWGNIFLKINRISYNCGPNMQAMQQHLCNHPPSCSLWATYNTGWSNTVHLMHKFCWQSRKNITNDLSAIE